MTAVRRRLLQRAIDLAAQSEGGPFGAVVARDGEVIAEAVNLVVKRRDATAHAEILAIREACQNLRSFQLAGCEIFCSCEPNPMCLGAIYWARLDRIWYAATRDDAASAGFDDRMMYREVTQPIEARAIPTRNLLRTPGRKPFAVWNASAGKIRY